MKNHIALALSLLAVGCANYMRVEVEGRVVDENQRPVAGAAVTTVPWFDVDDAPKMRTLVKTDADGRFSATLPRTMGSEQALFADVGERLGGFVVLPGDKASGLEIVVRPFRTVRAQISNEKLPRKFRKYGPWINAVSVDPRMALVANRVDQWRTGDVAWRLPPGRYELHASGAGKPLIHAFEVSASTDDLDLGTLALEPTNYQRLLDQPAPDLHFADARGVPKGFRLADWRGKWVVLVFWNHRMEENRHVVRSLIDFHEAGEKMRDRFEVLIVHNSDDVLTVRHLDGALFFKRMALTVPVVIDDREKSFEAYGLERGPWYRSAPSEFLIDPEGRIVSTGFEVLPRLTLALMDGDSKKR